jgi:hypothetical protein
MGKKYLTEEESLLLIESIEQLKSHATWTKEKYDLKEKLMSRIKKNFRSDFYCPYADFKSLNNDRFYSWDYETRLIPSNQRGYLKNYRGRRVFILCTTIYKYGTRELLLIPLKK